MAAAKSQGGFLFRWVVIRENRLPDIRSHTTALDSPRNGLYLQRWFGRCFFSIIVDQIANDMCNYP